MYLIYLLTVYFVLDMFVYYFCFCFRFYPESVPQQRKKPMFHKYRNRRKYEEEMREQREFEDWLKDMGSK